MIEIFMEKLPVCLGLLLPTTGLVGFFAFKYVAEKRDETFRVEAEKLLDALDAERRMHAKKYSVHRELERRNIFDGANAGNKTSG